MPKFNLNSAEMTKVMDEVYLPALKAETWNNSGALSEAFGLMKIGKKVNAASGKLDVYIKKGTHGSVGSLGDDYTFSGAVQKPVGDEMVVRTRGFEANARLDVIPNSRMQAAGLENIFENQFEELGLKLKKNYARMLYGDGKGLITSGTGKTAAAALTPAVVLEANELLVEDVRSFEIGDIISVAAPTLAAPEKQLAGIDYVEADQEVKSKNAWATHGAGKPTGDTFMVIDIDEVEKIITLANTDKKGATDFTATGAKAAKIYYRNSINSDLHGLKYIISGEGYFGLGEAEYGLGGGARPKYMKPFMKTINNKGTGAGNFLTEYDFQAAIDAQELRGADLTMNFVVTSRGTRTSIASTNQGAASGILRLTRDAGATAANDQRSMGYQGVDIKGQEVEVDRFAPSGDINFLDLTGFEFALEHDLTLDNTDGQTWKQVTVAPAGAGQNSRVLAYEANFFAYKNLFNHKTRTLARISLGEKPGYIKADSSVVTGAVEYA